MRVYEARMDHAAFRVERFIRAVCGEDPLLVVKRGNASVADGNSATRYDAVIAPTIGITAFPHDETPVEQRSIVVEGKETRYGLQMAFAALAAFPGLPATAWPVGADADGMPTGAQAIAAHWQDHQAIAIARAAHALVRR